MVKGRSIYKKFTIVQTKKTWKWDARPLNIEPQRHEVIEFQSKRSKKCGYMSYQEKGLAILNNNPYPLQQTWSKAPEKTINRRSNSFIDMKTLFSKHKNLKRKQLVFFFVVSFD